MRILFVQSYLGKNTRAIYPIGLVWVASCLTGHTVRILDLNRCDVPFDELTSALSEFQPDVVGVSLRNIDNHNRVNTSYFYEEFRRVVKQVKEVAPTVHLVAGGAAFSMYIREIMERDPAIDFGVFLEGEETLPELLANLDNPQSVKGIYYRKNGQVLFSGARKLPDFERIPRPKRELADMSGYPLKRLSIGVQSKRGCPLDCSHCNYPFLSGKEVRVRPPKDVVDEIEAMVKEHGANEFMFVDPVFNVPKEHAEAICRELIRREIKVQWGAYLHIRNADEAFLVLAREAGCKDYMFSPDAAAVGALAALKKGITRKDIARTVRYFKQNPKLKDAFVYLGFFVSAPGENFIGLLKMLMFWTQLRWTLRGRGRPFVHWIRIEPETDVHRIALEKGVLKPDTKLLPDTAADLNKVFYRQPSLKHLDFLLVALHSSFWKRQLRTLTKRWSAQ